MSDGLTAAHVDGLLITSIPNIRYLTGFSGSSALLFVGGRDVILITDFRYQTQIAEEVGSLARISIESQSLWAGLWHQLSTLHLEVIGFESSHVLHRDFQRLLEAGARWHAQEALGREATQLASHDERDLRWRIAHDVRRFSLRETLVVEDSRNLLREHVLGDHRLGGRACAAFRFGSHGSFWGKWNEERQTH